MDIHKRYDKLRAKLEKKERRENKLAAVNV
jgi:hypothetical protein